MWCYSRKTGMLLSPILRNLCEFWKCLRWVRVLTSWLSIFIWTEWDVEFRKIINGIIKTQDVWQAISAKDFLLVMRMSFKTSRFWFYINQTKARLFIPGWWSIICIHGPERQRHENICGKFLHNAIASTAHTVTTTVVLRVPSTIGAEICLGCWRDRPFLGRTQLVFDDGVPMGRQEATLPVSDEDCIRIGEFPCYSHHDERLARLKQVPIFKVLVRLGRDSNHVEPRPTGHEASALPTRPHVRMIY